MKTKIGLACGLMLLGMLACNFNLFGPVPAPSPTPRPVARVDELRFKDAETGRRFRALDGCIKDIADDSWHTTSYQLVGNFYESRWCRGTGARSDCQIAGSTIDDRDQRVIELYTLFYPQSYPEVFGLGFHALQAPKSTGWGASYYFAENGAGIVGQGWGVTFREYVTPTGKPRVSIDLGWKYGYTIYGPNRTTFEDSSELPLREDLALYLASPESMRDRGLAHIQALEQKVISAISGHQVITCDLGPYLGKGLPPACTPRPLNASEETDELARARAYFAEQEQSLRDSYQEMYTAWMAAFPLGQCWP